MSFVRPEAAAVLAQWRDALIGAALAGLGLWWALAARGVLGLTGTPESFRFGWNQGIMPTERIQRMEKPSMRSVARIGEDLHAKKRQSLEKSADKVTGQWTGSVHYAGVQSRYFTILGIVPQEEGAPVEGTIRLGGDEELVAQSWAIDVPAGRGVGDEIAVARLDYFIGPQDAELLQGYGRGLEKSMDLGWKWIRPLSEVVLFGMNFMHRFIPNYGVIIIIFSVLTKLAFYPLTRTSTQSMKKMQLLQPKVKALQEKYKDNQEKQSKAMMELYKKEKVNPMAGCLPLLLQMPVFVALYQALARRPQACRQQLDHLGSCLKRPSDRLQRPPVAVFHDGQVAAVAARPRVGITARNLEIVELFERP